MSELWAVKPNGELAIYPHPGQWQAWCSARRFIAMFAGTQGGKTSFLPLWMWREIRRCGAGDYLAVTATFPLLDLKMGPEFRRLFQDTLKLGTYAESRKVLEFKDGKTRIIFGSATHPESLESATAKAAVLDEAGQDQFRGDSWDAIQRRLSLHQGRALIGTTLYNLGWLKQRVYDRWRAGDPDYEVIQFPSTVNPAFPPVEFERARRDLPTWKFRMFYEGQFERPAGLIYQDYREDVHSVKPFDIPAEWPRFVGLDFGAVNTAQVWMAHDTSRKAMYVYREKLEGGKTTPEHAAAARAIAQKERVVGWFGGAPSETQQRMDWAAANVPVLVPPIPDVEAQLDRVIGLFKQSRLFVFDNLSGLRDELGTYSREMDSAGQVTEKIKDKEQFHRLDALRYVVCGALAMSEPAIMEV